MIDMVKTFGCARSRVRIVKVRQRGLDAYRSVTYRQCSGIVLIAAVMFWWWIHDEVCDLPIVASAMTGSQRTTCFEFWLNRYQTLVGAGVALYAAALAFRISNRQMREVTAQQAREYVACLKIFVAHLAKDRRPHKGGESRQP